MFLTEVLGLRFFVSPNPKIVNPTELSQGQRRIQARKHRRTNAAFANEGE